MSRKNDWDMLIAVLIILFFSFFVSILISKIPAPATWSRYELHVLKICKDPNCKKSEFYDYLTDEMLARYSSSSEAKYSQFIPNLGENIQMVSFSIYSKVKINIIELSNEILKEEKCQREFREVDTIRLKVDNLIEAEGGRDECKIFFLYQRKF